MKLLKSVAYGLILCTALAGPANAIEPDAPEQLITRLDAVGVAVQKRLTAHFPANSKSKFEKNEDGALVEFYANDAYKPVWVTNNGLTERAKTAMKELAHAGDYGLRARDYELPKLKTVPADETISVEQLAEAEFLLSHSVLAYVRDARGGRMPAGSVSRNLDPTLDLADPLAVMEKLAHLDDVSEYLRSFHPQHPQFEALRQVMLKVRGGNSKEEKLTTVPKGPVIRPGQSHKQITLVRLRMKISMPETGAEKYDDELVAAVKDFQKSRGLNAEGIIGPATRRAMNGRAQPKDRIKTILANMERWRWFPVQTGLSVQVNIPEYTIRVLDGLKAIHTERVVVGKLKNQTPVFSDEMEYIVFHPYWNVPNSIKVNEILPNVRRSTVGGGWFGGYSSTNTRWLKRNGLHIKYNGKPVDPNNVNWNKVDVRKFHFYQKPGGSNVLGFVKFMFPNKHIVYMHDTPTKHLFNQTSRAYSHGCMRIRNPRKLAEVLLSRDSGWTPGRVGKAIQNKSNRRVTLKNKIPVHMVYFTAKVRKDGTVRYLRDLYGHDARMARALKL